MQVYRVSWTDAKHGCTVYDTASEKVARQVHSDLMVSQLTNGDISDVRVRMVDM